MAAESGFMPSPASESDAKRTAEGDQSFAEGAM